jgi:flagellar basal-body rod modification protein FlgD
MTTISPIGTQAAAPTTGTGTGQGTLIGSDFQTFLKMLTTQARNQDPLSPMDSSDYAQQLATFSGVEQQVRTNSLLESLASQFGANGLAQFASWVGMEAKVTAAVPFDGTPLVLYPAPAAGADQTVLVALDAAGHEVMRSPAPVGTDPVLWAGADAAGQSLSQGLYSFRLESYAGGELIGTSEVASYTRIAEVRNGTAGTSFVLLGGSETTAADISALRAAA